MLSRHIISFGSMASVLGFLFCVVLFLNLCAMKAYTFRKMKVVFPGGSLTYGFI